MTAKTTFTLGSLGASSSACIRRMHLALDCHAGASLA
jgi:hypothetical protein